MTPSGYKSADQAVANKQVEKMFNLDHHFLVE
jgi:hypothetical protein